MLTNGCKEKMYHESFCIDKKALLKVQSGKAQGQIVRHL